MAKRRKRIRQLAVHNPLLLYGDMVTAGLQMAELFISSGQVIAHRSDMMARAMKGEVPLHHKEFTDMWMEKILAGTESLAAAMKHMSVSRSKASSIRGLMNAVTPYRKRASANARRLNKK